MSSEAAIIPEDVVKLQAAVIQLDAVVRNVKRRDKEYRELAKAADGIQSAVVSSCKRKAIAKLPLFAQPIVDIATKVFVQCAADMEETETVAGWLFRRSKLKPMRNDCARAIEAFHYILQIEDGRSLLIESDGGIKFPRPPGWEDDNSELGGQISSWNAIWDGIKTLLGGMGNTADGAVIPIGPEPIKAIVQVVTQTLKHVEDYHASKESIEQLQTTIELYWDAVVENYVPRDGARDALDERVEDFLRLLQRTVIRLYLLRATPWLKRFIAVSIANELIAAEKRAMEEAKSAITLALGVSVHACVRGNKLEILRGHNKVEGVGELVRGVAGMFHKARDHDKLERWLAVGRNVDDRQRELQAMATTKPDWFFDEKFDEWKNAEKGSTMGLYWISSDPGSGKSVLLSAVVQHLPPEDRVFFHFDMRNGQPTLRDFLAAVVSQLGHRLGGYPSSLIDACEKGYEQTASEEILQDAATEMLSSASMILAIDALDECPKLLERWKTVKSLLDALRGTGARIVVSSRRGNFHLVQYMTQHAGHRLHLNDSTHHHVLLEEYIDLRLADFLWPVERKVKVASILKAKAEGMFLWASLHLDRMQSASPQLVEDMLREIPESLDDTYRTIIESFATSAAVINSVSHVLQCLALSYESLSPRQVAELLVTFEFPCLDQLPRTNPPYQRLILPVEPVDIPEPEAFVLSHLPALFRITEDENGGKVVRFIHISIVEYLQSTGCRSRTLVHLYAFHPGMAHMTWLRICLTILENHIRLDLTAYAKRAWVHHIECLVGGDEDILGNYLTPPPASLRELFSFGSDVDHSCFTLACKGGQIAFVAWFLAHGADVTNSPDITWTKSPLLVAAAYGHIEIVELLIRNGASITAAGLEGYTALLHAACHGHSDICSLLLDKGSDIGYSTAQGVSALHLAAYTGCLGAVRVLLEYGAEVDAATEDSLTPLYYGTFNGHTNVVELLILYGASLTLASKGGWTALHLAAAHGKSDLCSLLLDKGSDIAQSTQRSSSALHFAALNGNFEAARVLIDHGAQVDAVDEELATPLHLAARHGHMDVVVLLIQHDASLTITCRDNWTALLWAACGGHSDLCSLLLNEGSDIEHSSHTGSSALHLAAKSGNIEVARVLIDHGARLDAVDKDLRTPLHRAALDGYTEVAKLLIHHHAPLSVADIDGQTALHYSAHEGHTDMCSLLLEKGSDVNLSSQSGTSALHMASVGGHFETVHLLIEYGAHVDAVDEDLTTPLHLAALTGHAKVVEFLIHRGASLAMKDKHGCMALFWAAVGGNSNLCSLLLDKGSDVLHSNLDGQTALHAAASRGNIDVACLLLDRQASVTARDINGETPRDVAERKGHEKLVALLLSWEQPTAGNDAAAVHSSGTLQ